MLGYTGTHQGRPVSVQATGMGCPSAAIVIEELIQLGVKRLIRVGTCGGLSSEAGDGRCRRRHLGRPRRPHRASLHGRRAARPDSGLRRHARDRARGQGDGHPAARRPDRQLRHVLRPRPRAASPLGRPRRPRRRDGGGGALHDRRAARSRGRVRAGRLRPRRRRGVRPDQRRGARSGRRADDPAGAARPRWTTISHHGDRGHGREPGVRQRPHRAALAGDRPGRRRARPRPRRARHRGGRARVRADAGRAARGRRADRGGGRRRHRLGGRKRLLRRRCRRQPRGGAGGDPARLRM